jgi:Spy/CpxP family protein refolding chaperone
MKSILIVAAACAALASLAHAAPPAQAVSHEFQVAQVPDAPDPPDDFGPMAEAGPPGAMPPDPMGYGGPGMGGMGHGMGMGGGMRMGPRGFEAMLDRLTGPLAITAKQREKLEAIRDKQQRDDIRTGADLQIARLDLHGLIEADNADRGAINSQIDKIAQMQAAMQKSRVGAMLEGRAVLTAEQRAKLEELRHTPRGRDGSGRDGSGKKGGGSERAD